MEEKNCTLKTNDMFKAMSCNKEEPPAAFHSYFSAPNSNIKLIDNLSIHEFDIDKCKELFYAGNEEYKYLAMLGFNEEELEKYCKGDELMEQFKDKVMSLIKDKEFKKSLTEGEEIKNIRITVFKNVNDMNSREGRQNRLELAKFMLNKKLNIHFISEVTGLSEEQIIALNNEPK